MSLEQSRRPQPPGLPTAGLGNTNHIYLRSGLTVAAFAAHLVTLATVTRTERRPEGRQRGGLLSTADSLFQALTQSHHFRQDTALGGWCKAGTSGLTVAGLGRLELERFGLKRGLGANRD